MAAMTPQEQLMLELVNRARMDPNGEAKRFGIKLNEGVAKGDRISGESKQVLAGNDDLVEAADNHSDWMLLNDVFSHTEANGSPGFTGRNPSDRMDNAGYDFAGSFAAGENISFRGSTGTINATKEIMRQHKDLFVDKGVDGRGHRLNILSDAFQEIGIGQEVGKFRSGGTNFNASMVTQDFARSGNSVFIVGVVYNDTVKNDDFFSVGEQVAGLSVNGGAAADTTGAGGGYELLYSGGGARTVTFGGGVTVALTLGNTNVKIDLVNGNEIWTNASVTSVSTNVSEVHALGIDNIDLAGSATADALFGNKGRNTLTGNAGADMLDGGAGKDELHGNAGADIFFFARGDTGKTKAKADVIADFSTAGGDIIDVSAWDANAKKKGNQDFDFIGDQAFHKHAGELRAFVNGAGDTIVQGDTNGDGKADLMIRLAGNVALTDASFDL